MTPHIVWFQLYEMFRIGNPLRQKVDKQRLGGRGWGLNANGYGVSFRKDKNVLNYIVIIVYNPLNTSKKVLIV